MAALRWAVTEARLHGTEVWAVHAWSSPMKMLAPYAPRRGVPSREACRQASGALLTAVIRSVCGSEGSAVGVRPILVEGHPIPVLLRYAAGAHLLVLGRRLRSRNADGSTLGVVVRTCLAYARCPTVIIGATEVVGYAKHQPDALGASESDGSSPSSLPV
jgi:hypothetical protein